MYKIPVLLILVIFPFHPLIQCRPQGQAVTQTTSHSSSTLNASTTPIPIILSTGYFGPDGSFNYSFETANGINIIQTGVAKRVSSLNNADNLTTNEEDVIIIQGSYSYTAPEGVFINITYTADENGYQPQGDSIPTPPPLPSGISNPGQQQHNATTSTTTSIPIYPNPTA